MRMIILAVVVTALCAGAAVWLAVDGPKLWQALRHPAYRPRHARSGRTMRRLTAAVTR